MKERRDLLSTPSEHTWWRFGKPPLHPRQSWHYTRNSQDVNLLSDGETLGQGYRSLIHPGELLDGLGVIAQVQLAGSPYPGRSGAPRRSTTRQLGKLESERIGGNRRTTTASADESPTLRHMPHVQVDSAHRHDSSSLHDRVEPSPGC
jgi:hypothetical protein